MNRSRPLSPGATLNCRASFCAAAALRIEANSCAVGTNIRNSSLNWLLPAGTLVPGVAKTPSLTAFAVPAVLNAGTSMLSKPGPSIRTCSGVPSAARDTCCRADSCPMRGSPVKVAFWVALAEVNWPALSWASG
jgi:hypothetical protein